MDKKTIKRIITRESFVLLGFILLMVCLLNAPNIFSLRLGVKKEYKEAALKIKHFTLTRDYAGLSFNSKGKLRLYLRFLNEGYLPNDERLSELIRFINAKSEVIPLDVYNVDKLTKIDYIRICGLFILFFDYLFYLLIRFIFWKLRMLKV